MTPSSSAGRSRHGKIVDWADSPETAHHSALRWLHRLVRICLITLRETERNKLSLRSGALTYALLLSLVPMLAMSTAVIKGLGGGNQLRDVVYSYIDTLEQATPAKQVNQSNAENGPAHSETTSGENGDLASHLRSATDKIFDYVDRTNFATLGTFGMLGIFLSVILVLGQIEAAMNQIWHVEDGRSILRKISDYLTMMVLMPIALNVALAAGAVLKSKSLAMHLDQFLPTDWLQSLLLQGLPVLVLTLTLYIVYIFFPNTKLKTIPTLTGALIGGFLWFATQNVYISMQIGVAKYNAIYGSFATIPLFLAWMYLGWLFILLGAQIAFAIQNVARYRLVEKTELPSIRLSSALDVCSLVGTSFREGKKLEFDEIASELPMYSRNQLEETRDTLIAAGILHHSGETGEIMPSRPPESISNQQIIETVLGTEPPPTVGGTKTAVVVNAAAQALPDDRSGEENIQGDPGTETSHELSGPNQESRLEADSV